MKTSFFRRRLKRKSWQRGDRGAALVVVLVLLVLMLGVVLAFFSQSILQRQVAKSSASQTAVDLLAQGAANTLAGDLQNEIKAPARSLAQAVSGTSLKIYRPLEGKYAVPGLSGLGVTNPANLISAGIGPKGMENVLKISRSGAGFYDGTSGVIRASAAHTTDASVNGRFISLERWNRPLLMNTTSFTKPTPPAEFTAPDWILVDREGKNPLTPTSGATDLTNTKAVVGRYAYVIYNEGGLLDANVTGYPAAATNGKISDSATQGIDQTKYKGSLSYADLTQIGLTDGQVEQLVGWRNKATLGGGAPSVGFYQYAMKNQGGFLDAANTQMSGGQTDKMFVGRQQLIDYFKKQLPGAQPQTLQYLTTFSRSLDQPSRWPLNPTLLGNYDPSPNNYKMYPGGNSILPGQENDVNPPFQKIRATTAFSRNDGSKAVPGEPLVKHKFDLNRLCWLTYQGPMASHLSGSLYDAYLKNGISADFLKQGTAANIQKYFGLVWVAQGASGFGWKYKPDINGADQNIKIDVLKDIAVKGRDPNFFELLKAAISPGTLGKQTDGTGNSLQGNPTPWVARGRAIMDTYIDNQIIQIGANIMDQFDPDNYPTRIVFTDNSQSKTHAFFGTEDLPYFYGATSIDILLNKPTPALANNTSPSPPPTTQGRVADLQVPIVWNPHAYQSQVVPAGLNPSSLRIWVTAKSVFWPSANGDYSLTQQASGQSAGVPTTTPWNTVGSCDFTTGIMSDGDATALTYKNDPTLYRDPSPLMRVGLSDGLATDPHNTTMIPATGITDLSTNDPNNKYLGFYVGTFNLQFSVAGTWYTTSSTLGQRGNGYGNVYVLEYQLGGAWFPYKQITLSLSWPAVGASTPYDIKPTFSPIDPTYWRNRSFQGTWDPRAERFMPVLFGNGKIGKFITGSNNTQIETFRPDNNLGVGDDYSPGGLLTDSFVNKSYPPNNMFANADRYMVDADGFVRRGMGAYIKSSQGVSSTGGTIGIASAPTNVAANIVNRPIILQRPFRSVAELGHVFSDTPWRNIDFMTPESGFSGLLDVFCVGQSDRADALVAGKVDLNTRQKAVVQAIVAGAYRDESKAMQDDNNGTTGSAATDKPLTKTNNVSSEAYKIANALVQRTTNIASSSQKGPLLNIADLVGRYDPVFNNTDPAHYSATTKFDGFSGDLGSDYSSAQVYQDPPSFTPKSSYIIQRFREAAIRALSDTGQAGTWNLLIDLIAQTGHYPSAGGAAAKFLVQAERRIWLHVAIDRQTGKVIDKQLEIVNE